jgi:hypothetical protein
MIEMRGGVLLQQRQEAGNGDSGSLIAVTGQAKCQKYDY